MSRFGTGLSRLLSCTLVAGLVLIAVAAIAALAIGAMALLDPAALASGNGVRINGMPVYMAHVDSALFVSAAMLAICGFGATMIWQLLGMLRSAAAGQPFVMANVRRLRIIAALFGVVLVIQMATAFLPETVQDLYNLRLARFDLGAIFSAMAALVLAEVFKAGVALREDAEGTI